MVFLMGITGCDDDTMTGPDPTPPPPSTPTPTMSPTPEATVTPTPAPRSFEGDCINGDTGEWAGTIQFILSSWNDIDGTIRVTVPCTSSEAPYSWDTECVQDFFTGASDRGTRFSWRWDSPSPVYTEFFEITGEIDGAVAAGTWRYHFQSNSHHTSHQCGGMGTWSAVSD